MPRNRVLSFMRELGQRSPTTGPVADAGRPPSSPSAPLSEKENSPVRSQSPSIEANGYQNGWQNNDQHPSNPPRSPNTPSRARADSRGTRPNSMIQTYQPPQVDFANDTPPELQPIFSYLNSHSNKLYQEGYFLKLHDLDSRGRPSQSRVWNECFAQLVGTVLSLWDAAALDVVGEDGEVVPTFINLSDASIKMIESLPMNGAQGGSLQNVLSVSTAANNRYLLHFNSLNSLTQWTAGIRLAMFEHSTLQEAYTGSLIAGKGKFLNNIKQIMERSIFTHEDWARVRFGAGTPWKRLWCVISPPDEKEYQKSQKVLKKTASYGRAPVPKGNVKFYDTRKVTKKTRPVVTITDAYAAYAIYPQSKPLIDQSTLVKLEGLVTIHSSPETTAEGFVFVMPEVHPAVSGFEMMLRWLFPVLDTFALYGRPNRLIADTLDQRGLMFAMPRDRRYGYLDILDVSALIHTSGSQNWSERQWRREMKKLTSTRMTTQMEDARPATRQASGRRATMNSQSSLHVAKGGVRFEESESIHSSPASRTASPIRTPGGERVVLPQRTDSAPPRAMNASPHTRSVSDAQGYRKYITETPSRLSHELSRPGDFDEPPPPPRHDEIPTTALNHPRDLMSLDRVTYGHERSHSSYEQMASQRVETPDAVITPPAFTHGPNSRPVNQPWQAPDLRRAQAGVDAATLLQMREATRPNLATDDLLVDNQAPRFTGGTVDDVNRVPRDSRQRLSTIPGSPFVGEDAGYFEASKRPNLAHLDGVSEDSPHFNGQVDERPPLVPLHSSHSIARKPVKSSSANVCSAADPDAIAGIQSSQVRAGSPPSPPGSFEGALIDQAVLERILNHDSERSNTMTTAASSTPDYASTASASSRHERKPVERPRVGQLKTVGNPDLNAANTHSGRAGRFDPGSRDAANPDGGIPIVDFGPTYSYKPTVNSRPGTSGTLTPGDANNRRSRSAEEIPKMPYDRPIPPLGQSTSAALRNNVTQPISSESLARAEKRNSLWSPGAAAVGGTLENEASLTPEQWVQYRARLVAQPQQIPRRPSPSHVHQRSESEYIHNIRHGGTKTPPPSVRAASGDWDNARKTPPPFIRTQSGDHSQYASRPPVERRGSRDAAVYEAQHRVRQAATRQGQQAPGNGFQQAVYQQAVVSPDQAAYHNYTVQQPRSQQAPGSWRQQYGPGLQQQRQQVMQRSAHPTSPTTPQYVPPAGGFGGAYVQQQGVTGQPPPYSSAIHHARNPPSGSDVQQQRTTRR